MVILVILSYKDLDQNGIENSGGEAQCMEIARAVYQDRPFVIDKGEVVQKGSYEELFQQEKGVYYKLWNAQAQYYTSTMNDNGVNTDYKNTSD